MVTEVGEENSDDTLYSFGLLNTNGVNEQQKTYRLPKQKQSLVNQKMKEIESLLSGDSNLDVCILLELLSDKIKK